MHIYLIKPKCYLYCTNKIDLMLSFYNYLRQFCLFLLKVNVWLSYNNGLLCRYIVNCIIVYFIWILEYQLLSCVMHGNYI